MFASHELLVLKCVCARFVLRPYMVDVLSVRLSTNGARWRVNVVDLVSTFLSFVISLLKCKIKF
jgi:hypothetical protein